MATAFDSNQATTARQPLVSYPFKLMYALRDPRGHWEPHGLASRTRLGVATEMSDTIKAVRNSTFWTGIQFTSTGQPHDADALCATLNAIEDAFKGDVDDVC